MSLLRATAAEIKESKSTLALSRSKSLVHSAASGNGTGKVQNLERMQLFIKYGYFPPANAQARFEALTLSQVTVGDMKDGKPQLAYDPPNIDAKPGEYVQFNFKAQNHTVTQSTLEKPCVKMAGGMDSGFMPNPNNTMPVPPSMMVEVNDTQPLCKSASCPQWG
jgi:plastocyanin